MAENSYRYRRIQDAAVGDLDGKTVVYDPRSGSFFGLNRTARALWDFLGEWRTVDEAAGFLSRRYRLGPEVARKDASAFIGRMREKGLVDPHPGEGGA